MDIKDRLANYVRAGYAGLFVVSHEEKRVESELLQVAKATGFELYTYTITDSLVGPIGKVDANGNEVQPQCWKGDGDDGLDPIGLLRKVNQVLPERAIVLAKDYHLFVSESNPVLIRAMKDCLDHFRNNLRRFVILGCGYKLCPELEKEFTMVEFALPTKDQLEHVAKEIAECAGIHLNGNTEAIRDAASGMTTTEAADAFSLAVVEADKKDMPALVIAREKSNVVKKNGLLEIVKTDLDWNRIGGMQCVKDWISKRRRAFTKEADTYHLPKPKGVLLIGVPGCGKTMCGKAIANILGVPLLKLDGGKLFGSLVGQSESNTRAVIQTAEAVAPCVLFIDELEKALSGSKSSGETDGGTASRVLGTLLQWLQDKTSPVFVVATANDISQLPPELLRKGRWDEMFFVDLPDSKEREEIANVVAGKFGRKAEEFDATAIAGVTANFTGAEIEGAWVDAMHEAFAEEREVTTADILVACNNVQPITKTMGERIQALRNWCQGRARLASERTQQPSTKKGSGIRKIA